MGLLHALFSQLPKMYCALAEKISNTAKKTLTNTDALCNIRVRI